MKKPKLQSSPFPESFSTFLLRLDGRAVAANILGVVVTFRTRSAMRKSSLLYPAWRRAVSGACFRKAWDNGQFPIALDRWECASSI